MRLLRPRFTVRRMMIRVAIAGVFFALVAYGQRLRMMAARHESEAFQLFTPVAVSGAGPVGTIHRRVPGQPGTLAYQPTPQGLEHMKAAGDYAHAASNVDMLVAGLLLVVIIIGIARILSARRTMRRVT